MLTVALQVPRGVYGVVSVRSTWIKDGTPVGVATLKPALLI
jgi:hypothetical protein